MREDFLLVGLGNPGPRYEKTRHNMGFMVLDSFATSIDAPSWREKFQGLFCRVRYKDCWISMLKPTTFMNLSGQSVVQTANFFKIEKENLLVVHDDLDLPFGTLRVKKGGGSGGHKGVESIKQHLGNVDFTRLRLGIGRPQSHPDNSESDEPKSENITNFVLDEFSQEEKGVLTKVIDLGEKAVECIIRRGVTAAMNEFNKRGGERDGS